MFNVSAHLFSISRIRRSVTDPCIYYSLWCYSTGGLRCHIAAHGSVYTADETRPRAWLKPVNKRADVEEAGMSGACRPAAAALRGALFDSAVLTWKRDRLPTIASGWSAPAAAQKPPDGRGGEASGENERTEYARMKPGPADGVTGKLYFCSLICCRNWWWCFE